MYYVFTDTFAYLIGAISCLRFRQLRECPDALAPLPNPQIWGISYYPREGIKRPKFPCFNPPIPLHLVWATK